MTVVPQSNLNEYLDYQAFILHMRDIVANAKVIKSLFTTSEEEWDRSRDIGTGNHFIRGVFHSPQKTEAVKTYIAKLVKMHMISLGSRLTAWTKDTVAGENPTNIAISNRIAAIEFKNNRDLFKIVATRLIGFDDALVAFALEEDVDAKAKLLMDYLSARFDMSVNGEKSHLMYIDQTVDLSTLLKTDGFTPEFFADHLHQATKYFESFAGGVVNHWDLFDLLDVVVQVNAEHNDNKLYDELSTAKVVVDGAVSSAFEIEIDQDDSDVVLTLEICVQHHGDVNATLPKDIEYTQEIKDNIEELIQKSKSLGKTLKVTQPGSDYAYAAPIEVEMPKS